MIYAADFETTSYDDFLKDGCTRVYLWCIQDINKKQIINGDTIDEFIAYLMLLDDNSTIFFHNLAFDGEFIVYYLLTKNWTYGKNPFQFETVITQLNQWFAITIHYPNKSIYIKDSYKKFPGMSIADLSATFKIEEKPFLDVTKRRDLSYIATKQDIQRCKGDVRILAHALRETFKQGMDSDTSSTDALRYFMRTLVSPLEKNDIHAQRIAFKKIFPSLLVANDTTQKIEALFRKGYFGGLTYLNPKYKDRIIYNVDVYDRNSMYPAVMVNHPLPYGRAHHKKPGPKDLYIIELNTSFKLKDGHIPFIQNKCGIYRDSQVMTESKDFVHLVLASPLYELFHTNYDVEEEILSKWVFSSKIGLFDKHINHFMNIKANATNPGEKMMAKYRLNGLYGKFGQDNDRVNKIPVLEENKVKYVATPNKKSQSLAYLPVAIFTTAWSKYDLIKEAEKFGDNFVYCDTDSIHVIHTDDNTNILNIHPTKLGYWKLENNWKIAKYMRPKMYLHGHIENGIQIVDEVKAAGAPDQCKKNMTFENLQFENSFDGKLTRKRVPGGCVLIPTTFKIQG